MNACLFHHSILLIVDHTNSSMPSSPTSHESQLRVDRKARTGGHCNGGGTCRSLNVSAIFQNKNNVSQGRNKKLTIVKSSRQSLDECTVSTKTHLSPPPRKVVELCTSIAAIFQNETDVSMNVSQRRNKNLLYLESIIHHSFMIVNCQNCTRLTVESMTYLSI